MTKTNQANPKPRRRKRRVLLLLFVLGATALFLHGYWLPPLIEAAAPSLARRLGGLELELEEVRRADVGGLELRGLRLRDPRDGAVLLRLRVDSLAVEYSLATLVRGDLEGLTAVRGAGVALELDLSTPPEQVEEEPDAEPFVLPNSLPQIELSGIEVVLRLADGGKIAVENASLAVDAASALRLTTGKTWVAVPDPVIDARESELSLRWSEQEARELRLTLDGQEVLRESTVALAGVGSGAVGFALNLAPASERGELRGDLDQHGLRWEVALDSLQLESLEALTPLLATLPLKGRVELSSSGELLWADPAALEARASVEVTGFRGFDQEVDRASLDLTVGDRLLSLSELVVDQGQNHAELRDARLPLEGTDPELWLRRLEGTLRLELSDLTAFTGELELPELPEHRAEFGAHLAGGVLKLSDGFLDCNCGRLDLDAGEIRLAEDEVLPLRFDLSSRAVFDELAPLGRLFGRDDWRGRMAGALELRGTWPDLEGHLHLNGQEVSFGPMDFGSVEIDVIADEDSIRAEKLTAESGELQLDGSGEWLPREDRVKNARITLELGRLEAWIPGGLVHGKLKAELSASGSLAELVTRGTAATEGLKLGEIDIPTAGLAFSGHGREVTIETFHSESIFGVLDAAAGLRLGEGGLPLEVALEKLSLVRDGQGLTLAEPARIRIDTGSGEVRGLQLAGGAGSLSIAGSWGPERVEASLTATDLHPNLFLDGTPASIPKLREADFTGKLRWTPEELQLSTSGTLEELFLPRLGRSLGVVWEVSQTGEQLQIARFEVLGGEDLTVAASGTLPMALFPDPHLPPGPLSLDLQAHVPIEVLSVMEGYAGAFEVNTDLGGTWEAIEGTIAVRGAGLEVPEELELGDLGMGAIRGELRLGEDITIEGLALELGELIETTVDGRLETDLDVRRWIAEPGKMLEEARLHGECELGSLDLDRLRPLLGLLGETGEQLRSGRVSGSFQVDGPLAEPEYSGVVRLEDGLLRLGAGLPSADRVKAELTLVGSRFEIASLSGELGGAPFAVTGWAELGVTEPAIEFHLEGEDLLLFRSRDARIRADASLDVSGPISALRTTGRLSLSDGRYAPTTEFLNFRRSSGARGARGFQLFRLREAPLADMEFDIELDSTKPFQVRNTVIQGSVRPQLHLGGTGLVPVVTGTVYLERTLMKLPATTLELTGGTVVFAPESPFLPTVEAQGRTQMLGYEIRLGISGPYDSPEIVLSSTPPLGQDELLLLLLTGRLPDDPDRDDPFAAANTVALYLAKDTLARWFADPGAPNEDSLVNRFEFSSGHEVSKNGVQTIEVTYRLTNKEDKALSDRERRHLYLAGERDRYEDYNYGLRLVFRIAR